MKAFPHKVYLETTDPTVQNPVIYAGMDLRDYFAAKAIPLYFEGNMYDFDSTNYAETARLAYVMADAMMKAREQ
jgi:hypothetical protein